MRVVISKADDEPKWQFEAAFFDEERDLSLIDVRERQTAHPERHFEVQYAADHAFEALTQNETHL